MERVKRMFMMMMRPMLLLSTNRKQSESTEAITKQPIHVFFFPNLETTVWMSMVPMMVKMEPELSSSVETSSQLSSKPNNVPLTTGVPSGCMSATQYFA